MIKLLWRLALLIAAALGFAWLADRPGHVTISWLGRDIEMSVLVAVVLLAFVMIAILFVWRLLHRIWRSPTTAREYLRFRKQRKAYHSLSHGIIAAGAGDAQSALRHAAIAGDTLKNEPLVTLLLAQAAQLKGDRAKVKQAFANMAEVPETELLGLRGLFAEAKQAGDWPEARNIAERALAKNARLPWASAAILQVQITAKDWESAARTIANQAKAGILPRADAAKKQAALLAAQAIADEPTKPARALALALEAHGLDSSLVPAAGVAARCYVATDHQRKALKILRNTWTHVPHSELAFIFANSKPDETPDARFERMRDFVGPTEINIESACALTRTAIDAKRFDVAKETLVPFVEGHPQARVCGLMAEIENAQGDRTKSREWLARALHAARDPVWVSDGVASTKWVPVSPVTSEIVPCEWKPPFEMAQGGEWLQFTTEKPLLAATKVDLKPDEAIPRPDDPGVE